jgi:hypothetical protein
MITISFQKSVGAERVLILCAQSVAVSGMCEKREQRERSAEREAREWKRRGERKFNKLVERGAAFQLALASLACSVCDPDEIWQVT